MNETLKSLEKLFSSEEFSTLEVKNFLKNSVISSHFDKSVFVITKGRVNAVRHYEEKEYLAPYPFSSGDIVGFYGNYIMADSQWDFSAVTDVQIVLIPKELIEGRVLKELELYKFFNEYSAVIWNKIIKGYYLQIHGNFQTVFAYYLIEYSKENVANFIKTENIAKALNLSRSTVFKIEKEFIEKGLIKKVRKRYYILDPEKIKKYYQNYLYFD